MDAFGQSNKSYQSPYQDSLSAGDCFDFNSITMSMTPEQIYQFFENRVPEERELADSNITAVDYFGNPISYTQLIDHAIEMLAAEIMDSQDAVLRGTPTDEMAQYQIAEPAQHQINEQMTQYQNDGPLQQQLNETVQDGAMRFAPAAIEQDRVTYGVAFPEPEAPMPLGPYYCQPSSGLRPTVCEPQLPVGETREHPHGLELDEATEDNGSIALASPHSHPAKRRRTDKLAAITTTRLKKATQTLTITQKRVLSRQRNKNFDGSKVYEPLPATPEPWSWFEYNRTGGLRNGPYSADSILDYLYNHPLHLRNNNDEIIDRQKRSGLELFIQKVPADSNNRYPSIESKDCLFDECPMDRNNIDVGHFRVCFFEKRSDKPQNPYHNPGYVHLYCIEHFIDFPRIVRDLNVKPETRKFPLEPQTKSRIGKMELDRGLKSTATEFIRDCRDETLVGYPTPDELSSYEHKGTLTYRLHEAKLADENPIRGKVRAKRQGRITLDKHMGDIRFIMINRGAKRKTGRQTTHVNQADTPRGPTPKRRRTDTIPTSGCTVVPEPPQKVRRSSRGKLPVVQANQPPGDGFIDDTIVMPAPEWLQKQRSLNKEALEARWAAQAATTKPAQSLKRKRSPDIKKEDNSEGVDPALLEDQDVDEGFQ